MAEDKEVGYRHGHQLRSMGPPGDEKDDLWTIDVEDTAGLPLAGR